MHGAKDEDVKPKNLILLEQAVHEKGGVVQSVIYPDTDHISIVKDLTWIGNDDAPVLKDAMQFISTIDERQSANINFSH